MGAKFYQEAGAPCTGRIVQDSRSCSGMRRLVPLAPRAAACVNVRDSHRMHATAPQPVEAAAPVMVR